MKCIGVISALPSETKCISGYTLPVNSPVQLGNNLIVTTCGIGAERAQKAANQLLEKNVTSLISWGTAGGLVDKLNEGDLILPGKIMSSSGQNYSANANWIKHIHNSLNENSITIHYDLLANPEKILGSIQQKSEFQKKTGAVAVDMESAAIAKVAMERNVPFIAIRSIVDKSNMFIPACVLQNINEFGQPDILRLTFSSVLSPQQIYPLYQLTRAMSKATNTLNKVASKIDNLLSFD